MVINGDALYRNLYSDLKAVWPDLQPAILPEDSGSLYAAKVLLTTLNKKSRDHIKHDADYKALKLFLASNSRCSQWSYKPETLQDEYLLGEFRSELHRVLSDVVLSSAEIWSLGGTGPGASLGANGYDFYTKLFSSKLTVTDELLYEDYRHYCSHDPRWALAESQRMQQLGKCTVVRGSKLSFVPKRNDISRVICTEPAINMYGQKGIGEKLERVLKRHYSIDLATQPDRNAKLAEYGSATGRVATIDLSSASDSISVRMLRWALPADLFSWLMLFRSKRTRLPDGSELELEMVSSMGNGFTFPLETLLFSCAVAAAYRLDDTKWGGKDFPLAVFGDDIICATRVARKVIRLLELLGFQVNADKTFIEGPFRESCGADFFNGYPVRGVYVKSLATVASRYVAINRLLRWSAQHLVPLPNTLEMLLGSVPMRPVPLFENDDAGIRLPREYCGLQTVDGYITYQSLRPIPIRVSVRHSRLRLPKGSKPRIYNPEGLMLSFLRGDIRSATITIRARRVLYGKRRMSTSCWDDESLHYAGIGLARLSAVIDIVERLRRP